MVGWGDAKAPAKTFERKEIERLTLDFGDTKVRFIGDILPRYLYWITTTEGGKKPVECIRFSRETQEFDDTIKDPITEIKEEIYAEKPQFAYTCNVIDRRDGRIKVFDLKRTIYSQVIDFANNPEFGNPADAKTGYDIIVKKEKTGPLPQNVKYTASLASRTNSPLTKEELELELFELPRIHKRPTYDEQKQWLVQNTTYFAGEAGDEFKPESPDDLD